MQPQRVGQMVEKEIGWSSDLASILRKAQARYNDLLKRAREGGWEMQK